MSSTRMANRRRRLGRRGRARAYDEAVVRRQTGHPIVQNGRHSAWENCVGAWMMALDVARELDVSPWDALLLAVRLAAGRVAWVDAQLSAATRENDGDMLAVPVRHWLQESRKERSLLARTAKAAVDAGVAERLVRQYELEGQVLVRVFGRVVDELELSDDLRVRAFEVAQRELMSIEASGLREEPA